MKQKVTSSTTLTKDDLIQAFAAFEERFEKKMDAKLDALETRIDAKFTDFEARNEIKMNIRFEQMELRIDDRARQYNSNILTRFDQWAGELKTAQTERSVTANHIGELRKDIDGHEKRIIKLENN